MPLNDESFLAAIRQQPQEEAHWLVYADWLEERGDPRAALYRQRRLTNSVGMQFLLVPRGSFWMGGGGGRPGEKQVEIAQEFYLGVYPVTQGQWQAVMGHNPSHFSRTGDGNDQVQEIPADELQQFPVENVSWDEVQQFIRKLTKQDRDQLGWQYRLPTEEEWEYACRAAASTREACSFYFYFSQPSNYLSSTQANFNGNYHDGRAASNPFLARTTKVGSYPPNQLGFHDFHGNVWEWTASAWSSYRVFRGGSWNSFAGLCWSASRSSFAPDTRANFLGFRLARVPVGVKTL